MNNSILPSDGHGVADRLFVRAAHVFFFLCIRLVRVPRLDARPVMGDLHRLVPRFPSVGAAAQVDFDFVSVTSRKLARLTIGQRSPLSGNDNPRDTVKGKAIALLHEEALLLEEGRSRRGVSAVRGQRTKQQNQGEK